MKVSAIVAVAAGLTVSLVSAQLEAIPPCALSCAVSSLGSTGCATTDIACICSATAFLQALTPCVQDACSDAEFAATLLAAQALCAQAGVTLSIPTPGPTSTAPPAEESSTPPPETLVTSTVVPTTNSSITIITSPYPTSNATATSTELPSPTETEEPETPSATSAPSPSQSGGASRNAIALGGLSAAVIAFAAALL